VLAERHDLAYGTSRWSSKLVHGGLRYLARGEVGIAYESAVERGLIMARLAPHLTRALPLVLPWLPRQHREEGPSRHLAAAGLIAGNMLRRVAWTSRDTLPRCRRLTRAEVLTEVPALRREVTGGLLGWEGQLTDDARLVVTVARTAAGHGAADHLIADEPPGGRPPARLPGAGAGRRGGRGRGLPAPGAGPDHRVGEQAGLTAGACGGGGDVGVLPHSEAAPAGRCEGGVAAAVVGGLRRALVNPQRGWPR